MKHRIYMRVAKVYRSPGFKVAASSQPDPRPLKVGDSDVPTIHFVIDADIPREAFEPAKWPSIGLDVDPRQALALEVTQEEMIEP